MIFEGNFIANVHIIYITLTLLSYLKVSVLCSKKRKKYRLDKLKSIQVRITITEKYNYAWQVGKGNARQDVSTWI